MFDISITPQVFSLSPINSEAIISSRSHRLSAVLMFVFVFSFRRCEECGKGFIIKTALRTHMMNVHIKTRPYACQYGCGATYNDVSNRAHHENKKHGAVFNPEKHKALLQQQLAGN